MERLEIHNVRTLLEIKKNICTSFGKRLKSEPLSSYSVLKFHSECKLILYFPTMKKKQNKKQKNTLILLPFLTIAEHEPSTRKIISWSMTV